MDNDIKQCPFCGSTSASIEDNKEGEIGWNQVHWFNIKCCGCGATSEKITYDVLAEFSNYSVQDFRDNPIIRVKEEERYNDYIKQMKETAIEKWNNRV